jgi:pimeloyl-ACP methyl ester carboxylesterase
MITHSLHVLPHGVTLSCRSAGKPGRPALMFLHGFPEAAFVWDDLLAHFSQTENGGYHCIAPNLRGYEKSSAPTAVEAYRVKHLMQDIVALAAELTDHPLAALIAHDWGGAVAWNLAAARPELMRKLVIINSPHPATFLRSLQNSPAQQAASAYMNFLTRADAPALLAANDYQRLWELFTRMGAVEGPKAWLTDDLRQQYRRVWDAGLAGPCHYYSASPLRPPRQGPLHEAPAVASITLPPELVTTQLPTQVIWGTGDTALLPELLEGLEAFVPRLQLLRVGSATHWIIHEQARLVANTIDQFLRQP